LNDLSQERLRALLHYDPETGRFTWIAPSGRRVKAGSIAGCKTCGYIAIRIDGRRYMAHRLAWLYQTGQWPTCVVDHKNGERHDNRWSNLREATPSQNRANMRKLDRNTSGHKGVTRHRAKWAAQIHVGGKHFHLGVYVSAAEAAEAYNAAAKQFFGEFARAA
jgi:hypothetical protein